MTQEQLWKMVKKHFEVKHACPEVNGRTMEVLELEAVDVEMDADAMHFRCPECGLSTIVRRR